MVNLIENIQVRWKNPKPNQKGKQCKYEWSFFKEDEDYPFFEWFGEIKYHKETNSIMLYRWEEGFEKDNEFYGSVWLNGLNSEKEIQRLTSELDQAHQHITSCKNAFIYPDFREELKNKTNLPIKEIDKMDGRKLEYFINLLRENEKHNDIEELFHINEKRNWYPWQTT